MIPSTPGPVAPLGGPPPGADTPSEALSRAEGEIQELRARLGAVARSSRDAILTADGSGRILDANAAAERMFGTPAGGLASRPLIDFVAEHHHETAETHLDASEPPGEPLELAGRRDDGVEFPMEMTTAQWESPRARFVAVTIRDISERRKAERQRDEYERQLSQRALHDPLTFLPNRALLHDRVEHALELAARRGGGAIALVCLDIDRFKVVNDSLGLAIGDQLLRGVSERLKAVVRPGDTLARIGGDEFAVLFDEVEGRAEADRFAERVQGALANAFDVSGREVPLTACLGVAVAPGALSSADQVLRDAGVALDRARARGMGQRETYDAAMRGGPVDRLAVEGDLRRAIRQAQLRLFYQPIVDVDTGGMTGVEALIRWQHPTRGLLLPSQFIALAEDSGLIVPLGAWVLEEAVEQLAAWQREAGNALPQLRVSVNVSARQFQQDGWTREVARVLSSAGVDPARVVLEITESILVQDARATAERLSELRDLGVAIAIDDFGTGYSSLGYLKHFPVDILKIDKSFIDGVDRGPQESALAHAVIKLAGNLGLAAVAEGVSGRRQFDALCLLGCSYAQGYFFGRPQPPESVPALLARPTLIPDTGGG